MYRFLINTSGEDSIVGRSLYKIQECLLNFSKRINSNYISNHRLMFHTFTLVAAMVTRLHNLVSYKIIT